MIWFSRRLKLGDYEKQVVVMIMDPMTQARQWKDEQIDHVIRTPIFSDVVALSMTMSTCSHGAPASSCYALSTANGNGMVHTILIRD
mmetsp:Transcript_31429/g.65780  ORF Transcript_31429/g.65780 Transcript_31429/m.65780 type:complete len:87 (+) Transcript_31429:134-394(+)